MLNRLGDALWLGRIGRPQLKSTFILCHVKYRLREAIHLAGHVDTLRLNKFDKAIDASITTSTPNSWLRSLMFTGMASPATTSSSFHAQAEGDSDYGSDFSAGEEEILHRLLTEQERVQVIEDNPIVTDREYHGPAQTIRVPRVIGRGRISHSLQEESNIAKDKGLSSAALQSEDPDCELLPFMLCVKTTLTDAEASSEPS